MCSTPESRSEKLLDREDAWFGLRTLPGYEGRHPGLTRQMQLVEKRREWGSWCRDALPALAGSNVRRRQNIPFVDLHHSQASPDISYSNIAIRKRVVTLDHLLHRHTPRLAGHVWSRQGNAQRIWRLLITAISGGNSLACPSKSQSSIESKLARSVFPCLSHGAAYCPQALLYRQEVLQK